MGKKRKSQRKFFPGYILVEMEMDDNTWHIVKDTPKVTGFVGGSTNPTPLSDEEVKAILKQAEEGAVAQTQPKHAYQKGDRVRVIDGPFRQLYRLGGRRKSSPWTASGYGEHLRTFYSGGAGISAG